MVCAFCGRDSAGTVHDEAIARACEQRANPPKKRPRRKKFVDAFTRTADEWAEARSVGQEEGLRMALAICAETGSQAASEKICRLINTLRSRP